MDAKTAEVLWTLTPDWTCPHCKSVNLAIREKCRACGYDSNCGEFPWYNPLPPYEAISKRCPYCDLLGCKGGWSCPGKYVGAIPVFDEEIPPGLSSETEGGK